MFKTNRIAALLVGGALAALPAFSQEVGRSDAAVQAFGSFVKTTTQDGVQQSATNSGGVLASYRFFFSNNHGVEVNYGYSLNTQTFGIPAGPLGVKAHQHEATAAYVYRHPLRAVTPFVEAGVGGLVFDPKDAPAATTQTRAAFVYGAGADINLSSRVFVRAQYRGLVYNSPTFELTSTAGTDRLSHRAEPSIGFGYRF
jgi:outer membrane immunogenic protein